MPGTAFYLQNEKESRSEIPLQTVPEVLYRGNPQRTGVFQTTGPKTGATVQWRRNGFGLLVHMSPVVADGAVYFGSDDGRMNALDLQTGQPLEGFRYQSTQAKGKPGSPVAAANGSLYFGTEKGLLAINAKTGAKQWFFKTKKMVWTAPLVVGNLIYAADERGMLYAVDTVTHTAKWTFNANTFLLFPPAYDNGLIYFGREKTFYALNALTGEQKWKVERTDGFEWRAPAVAGGMVFVGHDNGQLYALDSTTGDVRWTFRSTGDAWSAPAIAGDVLLIGNKDGFFFGLEVATGKEVWRFKAEDWAVTDPVVADGVVYFGVGNHQDLEGPRFLHALDLKTGLELWKFQGSSRILASPAVADGLVIVATTNGEVTGLKNQD
ncbi:MAG: PQQ-binding-like beta-propeller repeat protein [Blastocatellia bacterium]|nr:PQQ-binding-like beta-propeller repeat protein [Blastocatellia bacterium]